MDRVQTSGAATSRFRAAGVRSVACLAIAMIQWAAQAHAGADLLVVTAPDVPIVRQVVETLTARSADSLGANRPKLSIDVRTLARGQSSADLAQQLKPLLPNYRAVFATSMALARAVQTENDAIPIVFLGQADPVQMCLAETMQRPGRSATGYMDYLPDDDLKMMEALVDGFPNLRTIYMLVAGSSYYVPDCGPNGRNPKPPRPPCRPGLREFDQSLEWLQQTPAVLQHARRLGVQVKFMVLCTAADFSGLTTLEPGRDDIGFVFALQGLYWNNAKALIAQVALARRPAIYGRGKFAKLGGVMALEPILDASDDRVVVDMLLRVLDGRSPATMPIQVPRGFRLTINARAAAAQGLQPSLKLLRRADEVILEDAR